MQADSRLTVIGAGMMGGALAKGFVRSETVSANQISLFDINPAAAKQLAADLGSGSRVSESAEKAVVGADVVLLAVKPPLVAPLLPTLGLQQNQLVISIAAGISTATIEAALGVAVPVVRAMPNTPVLVGYGATALCRGTHTNDSHVAEAQLLFGGVGEVAVVEERLMDAVTGLSGSGPAFIYLMIEALIDGGVKSGLPAAIARLLATQTVRGAAEMVAVTGEHPAQLKNNVTTPGGTTITGLAVLERSAVRAAFMDAVVSAAEKSGQLSGG